LFRELPDDRDAASGELVDVLGEQAPLDPRLAVEFGDYILLLVLCRPVARIGYHNIKSLAPIRLEEKDLRSAVERDIPSKETLDAPF
jgi:hypothetical protein